MQKANEFPTKLQKHNKLLWFNSRQIAYISHLDSPFEKECPMAAAKPITDDKNKATDQEEEEKKNKNTKRKKPMKKWQYCVLKYKSILALLEEIETWQHLIETNECNIIDWSFMLPHISIDIFKASFLIRYLNKNWKLQLWRFIEGKNRWKKNFKRNEIEKNGTNKLACR